MVIFVFNSLNKMKQVNHSEEMQADVNRHICTHLKMSSAITDSCHRLCSAVLLGGSPPCQHPGEQRLGSSSEGWGSLSSKDPAGAMPGLWQRAASVRCPRGAAGRALVFRGLAGMGLNQQKAAGLGSSSRLRLATQRRPSRLLAFLARG